ncbi:MAG TPA: helix-turn-helix domain-containing protein [Flavisolibacter sp.]|nr:helix-turn-helix domain-containing protein [Flavisolibacter sp.]
MTVEIITKQELLEFRSDLLTEIRKLVEPAAKFDSLKLAEVMKMLKCSPGTLQTLRMNGTLPFSRLGGSYRYERLDVAKILTNSSR